MSGNAAKDIQMAEESTQFIGFQSGNATVSSTKKYKEAWGNKANTGNYTETDIVMVSGSGLFRGVTREQIIETLSTKYKSLLNAAIKANASFRVGNQYEKGNLSDQLVAEYLQKNGYTEERLNGYSRWSKATAPTPAVQAAQEDMTGTQDATDMLLSMMPATPVEQQTELDMNNLNLTQPVVDYLYNQSSKRLSKDNFRQAAAAMIANLRASTPTDQILEKIKCL